MSGVVIDTNVLLVASAAHPYSPFDDTHVPAELQKAVFDWLAAFRTDDSRRLVIDDWFEIYDEYRNKLSDQDYGLLVIADKMRNLQIAELEWDEDGRAIVPPEFSCFDPSDRKFLAAALTDRANISIANATDTDWLEIEEQLEAAGVRVEHLLEDWLRAGLVQAG